METDGTLTIEPSVLCVNMFDCSSDVIVIGHVQLHHLNDSGDSAVTELADGLLALFDVSRAENVCVGGMAFTSDFNDCEA
jgi:hypothetical protein